MTDKLKKCPFCGSEAVQYEPRDKGDFFVIICNECSGMNEGDTVQEAIEAWNRRASHEQDTEN